LAIPFGVFFEPVTQTDFGIATSDGEETYVSGLGIVTFGFLVSLIDPWARCGEDETDTWNACTDESDTWTPIADESDIWSDCA
jgi:hypothetical protein